MVAPFPVSHLGRPESGPHRGGQPHHRLGRRPYGRGACQPLHLHGQRRQAHRLIGGCASPGPPLQPPDPSSRSGAHDPDRAGQTVNRARPHPFPAHRGGPKVRLNRGNPRLSPAPCLPHHEIEPPQRLAPHLGHRQQQALVEHPVAVVAGLTRNVELGGEHRAVAALHLDVEVRCPPRIAARDDGVERPTPSGVGELVAAQPEAVVVIAAVGVGVPQLDQGGRLRPAGASAARPPASTGC